MDYILLNYKEFLILKLYVGSTVGVYFWKDRVLWCDIRGFHCALNRFVNKAMINPFSEGRQHVRNYCPLVSLIYYLYCHIIV